LVISSLHIGPKLTKASVLDSMLSSPKVKVKVSIVCVLQDMESKKASEAQQTQTPKSTETVEQPSTAEKTDNAEDKNDKAPTRGMEM